MGKIINEFESLRYLRHNLEEMAHHLHQLDKKAEETKMSVERIREFFYVDAQYISFVNMYERTMDEFWQARRDMDECVTYLRMIVEEQLTTLNIIIQRYEKD